MVECVPMCMGGRVFGGDDRGLLGSGGRERRK